MNIFRVTVSLLAFSVSFAHGSYIPTEQDPSFNSVNLPPRDRLPPLSSISRSSLATSDALPSPSTPPSPKLLTPLPPETNGVLPNGAVINPNPSNNANAPQSPHSCWTKPVTPTLPLKNGDFSQGQCQVCVTRWDTGADPMFQFWIRDADNHAMGEMGATSLVADGFSNLTVAAGNKFFILWEMQMLAMEGFPDYDMVTMAWQANYTGEVHGQMGYIPSSVGKRSEQKCSFSGSTEGGAVTHFQCQFDCHP